ncbi:MAG: hypothetical protein KBD56_09155 [Candidatus Eisenbacteria bacterium]|nr:hypothetical protein [Candidatus Eisenbacteria bacterium]
MKSGARRPAILVVWLILSGCSFQPHAMAITNPESPTAAEPSRQCAFLLPRHALDLAPIPLDQKEILALLAQSLVARGFLDLSTVADTGLVNSMVAFSVDSPARPPDVTILDSTRFAQLLAANNVQFLVLFSDPVIKGGGIHRPGRDTWETYVGMRSIGFIWDAAANKLAWHGPLSTTASTTDNRRSRREVVAFLTTWMSQALQAEFYELLNR